MAGCSPKRKDTVVSKPSAISLRRSKDGLLLPCSISLKKEIDNPHLLELITTTDYVAGELCRQGASCQDQAFVEGVQVIKGQKFSASKITEAIEQLRANGYKWN